MSTASKLAEKIVRHAKQRGATVAIAESLTGGQVASSIVSVPGASIVLRLAVVAYATEMKRRVLGVDGALLDRAGAVDPKVAKQMAKGIRSLAKIGKDSADFGVATTGVAGPDEQDGKAVGTCYVAVAFPGGVHVRELHLDGDRRQVRSECTRQALALLLSTLKESTG